MASRRSQIITVAVIWVVVSGLGWHAYKNVLPQYGFFRQSRQNMRDAAREAWREAQAERDAFYKDKVPSKIWIKVRETDGESRVRMGGNIQRENNGVYYYARGVSMEEAYSTLSGTPNWRVAQLPREAQRWDIRIKAPEANRDQLAKAFLDYMNWDVKTRTMQMDGYRFQAGTPPAAPAAASAEGEGRRRGGQMPRMPLRRLAGMLSGRVNAPVTVDEAVRDKQPPGEGNIPASWNLRGDDLINYVASVYGVAVAKQPREVESFLVYHPKYSNSFDVGRWEREGSELGG